MLMNTPESPARAQAGPNGLHISIVEDNADSAETMAAVLRASGHVAAIAPNGLAGLVLAKKVEPDVVLLDIGLPVFNGFDVATSLREKCKDKPIIIAVTGYGEQAVRERALDSGFDHFFAKPVDLGMLTKFLETVEHG